MKAAHVGIRARAAGPDFVEQALGLGEGQLADVPQGPRAGS
jgi:hypothetical protein